MTGLELSYVTRDQIDIGKWDRCISQSLNRLPYGFSYYLDKMSPGWSAIISNDYTTVMPLTWRSKWGIRYLYQPAFTQQLGIFSIAPVIIQQAENILMIVKQRFAFAEIYLNFHNEVPGVVPKNNFILDLNNSYESIRADYKTDLLNNLRQSEKKPLRYCEIHFQKAISDFRDAYSDRLPHVTAKDYRAFADLCSLVSGFNKLVVRAIYDEEGLILCSALMIHDVGRLILVQSYNSLPGRNRHANHYLLDQVIREFSSNPLILDFEGSDIPGIAHFYQNFGAVNQPYFFLRHNNLPWFARLFKR